MAGLLVAALVVAVLLAAEVVAALVASKSCLSELYTVPCPQTVASIVVKILRKDGPAASAFLCLASRASARGFCRKHFPSNIFIFSLVRVYIFARVCRYTSAYMHARWHVSIRESMYMYIYIYMCV